MTNAKLNLFGGVFIGKLELELTDMSVMSLFMVGNLKFIWKFLFVW